MGSLSWLTWILCRKTVWSALAPLIMFYLLGTATEYGVTYPIFLFASHHTYGIAGRIYVLLTFLFMASGYRRIAWTMLGFAPAIHITWGAFAWAMGLGVALWEKWYTIEKLKSIVPWFALGIVFFLIPYGLILLQARDLPVIPNDIQTEYLRAFLTHWDFHRQPAPLIHIGIALALMSVCVNAWVLHRHQHSSIVNKQSARLLRILIIAGFGGLIGSFAAHYPQHLPDIINMGMPGRFINLVIMVNSVVLLGLWVKLADKIPSAKWVLMAYTIYLIWNQFFLAILSSNRFERNLGHWKFWLLLGALVFFIPLLKKIPFTLDEKWQKYGIRLVAIILLTVFAFGFSRDWEKQMYLLNSRTNRVYEAARAGEGMLIQSGTMQLVQLETGRPVLINTGGLDQISPMPATAPAIAEILDTVYGIDFFNPPDDIKELKPATLLPRSGMDVWEARSREDWAGIARQYGATQILTIAFVKLDLEIAEESGTLILYNLPQ
jgi:hypothetical protein